MADFDLVIRGGLVIDGSGAEGSRLDVGVRQGRIAEVGTISESGAEELDAGGCVVAPGFIDPHTHMDAQVFWDGFGASPAWHGVTSAVMGNCGFTLAPCGAEHRDLAIRSIERSEDVSRDAIELGVQWTWESFPEYLDAVEKQPKGINVGCLVGHSAVRAHVMGEAAFQRQATADEISAMCADVERAVLAGALGFSTSRSFHHLTRDDRPVASRSAAWEEVCALVGVLTRLNRGVFQMAPERDPNTIESFCRNLRQLCVESGRPFTFTPGGNGRLFHLLEEVSAEGGDITGQINVRNGGRVLSFMTMLPFDRLPRWRQLHTMPASEKLHRLRDSTFRSNLIDEAMGATYQQAVGAEAHPPDYARIYPLTEEPYVSVEELAGRRDITPVDVMIELAERSELEQLFLQQAMVTDDNTMLAEIRNPHTILGASDAGAHVSQIMDSAIPTYLLAHWVREKEALSWEEAVRMLTSDPARLMGLSGRGLRRPGFAADVVVFDPVCVAPELPVLVHDLPDGGPRLEQKARGILATIVNGQVLTRDGKHTGSCPGRLIRSAS
jgi:N-acyl-D-aspartate/D-glutamate deacylase